MTTPPKDTHLTYGLETIMTAEKIRKTLNQLMALESTDDSSAEYEDLQAALYRQLSMLFMWVEIDTAPLSKTS